jgi:hypothetical protein
MQRNLHVETRLHLQLILASTPAQMAAVRRTALLPHLLACTEDTHSSVSATPSSTQRERYEYI